MIFAFLNIVMRVNTKNKKDGVEISRKALNLVQLVGLDPAPKLINKLSLKQTKWFFDTM